MKKNTKFQPDWIDKAPEEGSYRSIFKYGDPSEFKHPSSRLYNELKSFFHLTDQDFEEKESTGNEKISLIKPSKLNETTINKFKEICGEKNVSTKEYDRVKFSNGKTVEEAMTLRKGEFLEISDIVVHPENKQQIAEIVKYCHENRIAIYVYGGGSSVNLGLTAVKGGVTIVLSTHLNKVVEINEKNQTVRVEAGMMGPEFERVLNNLKEIYKTQNNFTCGHFPQSFEYSSVGGWFVTLGSGQQSSYYGDAGDLVLAVEIITPKGTIKTLDFPATATGPKVLDIIKGSEGIFGIVVELTWKIFRYQPENRKYFGFIFKNWDDAVNASREISQGEFGMPSVFRISDPEETNIGLKLYGIEGTIFDKLMTLRGYKAMKRCLFLASADGEKSFTKNVKKNVKKICKKNNAMYLTSYPVKKWEKGRYKDPYLREDFMDYGLITDTLETGVKWDNFDTVYKNCKKFIKTTRPETILMSHSSHFYPQGTNLYFIFQIKEKDVEKYLEFQGGIIDVIQKSGGSLSHHHGVGKMIAPWMEQHLGKQQLDVLKQLKQYFDPNNIMNPGGQLGV